MRALQVAVAAVRSAPAARSPGRGAVEARPRTSADAERRRGRPRARAVGAAGAARRRRPAGATVTFGYRGEARHLDPYGLLLRDRVLVRRRARPRARRAAHVPRRPHRGRRTIAGADGTFDARRVRSCATRFPSDPSSSARRRRGDDAVVARVDGAGGGVEREVGSERCGAATPTAPSRCEVPCTNVPAFRSWVLGLLDHAEVLGPPEVRAALSVAHGAGADGPRPRERRRGRGRSAEDRLRRLLVMLPWLMERGEVPLAEVPPRFDMTPSRGGRRPRAGVDVRAAAVRRRDDRRVHRRRHRVRRRAPAVHAAAATHRTGGLRAASPPAGPRCSCPAPTSTARSDAGCTSWPRRSATTPWSTRARRATWRRRRSSTVEAAATVGERLRIALLDGVARRGDRAHDHAATGVQRPRRLVRVADDERSGSGARSASTASSGSPGRASTAAPATPTRSTAPAAAARLVRRRRVAPGDAAASPGGAVGRRAVPRRRCRRGARRRRRCDVPGGQPALAGTAARAARPGCRGGRAGGLARSGTRGPAGCSPATPPHRRDRGRRRGLPAAGRGTTRRARPRR